MTFRPALVALLLASGALLAPSLHAAEPYFPPRGDWARCEPQCRMDAAAVAEAVREVQKNENPLPRDQAVAWAQTFGSREPHFGGILGPMAVRGPLTGVVIHRGKVQAAFGEPERVDMSHSITKSFLSAVVGLAVQDGRIASVDEPVVRSMPREVQEGYFNTPKNAAITWKHLLQQTSDWEGTLWGRPDWADRPTGATPDDWPKVPRVPAGTVHEYNDVRVNLLALAALQVLRRPLPEVLRERLMEPMQASPNWRWHGYHNSWVELDGHRLQSVSGGGHWGGGLFLSAWDMARFGYLQLNQGRWAGRQLLDAAWLRAASTPSGPNPSVGYANFYLNTDRKTLPSAPASAVIHRGNGQNVIVVDRENELVVVLRWVKDDAAIDAFIGRLLAARR
jgi:CubicO group peptidase (beta-lactamase class C family)